MVYGFKRPWNKGGCRTIYGLRYLSTGSYEEILYDEEYWRKIWRKERIIKRIFEYTADYYGKNFKCATFSHGGWSRREYFYTSGLTASLYKSTDEENGETIVYYTFWIILILI